MCTPLPQKKKGITVSFRNPLILLGAEAGTQAKTPDLLTMTAMPCQTFVPHCRILTFPAIIQLVSIGLGEV